MNCPFCNGELKNRKIDYGSNDESKNIILENIDVKICSECGEYYVDIKTCRLQ